jgi:hypothetical protein
MNEKIDNEKQKMPIDYQFTPIPTNLIFHLDAKCLKMMCLLIQEESFRKSMGQLNDGCFFKSINNLSDLMPMCDKEVKLTLKTLQEAKLIEIVDRGHLHLPNLIKINRNTINLINDKSLTLIQMETKICKKSRTKSKKGDVKTHLDEAVPVETNEQNQQKYVDGQNVGQNDGQVGGQNVRQSVRHIDPPILYNVNNLNKSNNEENVNNSINDINIISNVELGIKTVEGSSSSLYSSNEQKEKENMNLNGENNIDASVPEADAQPIDPIELESRLIYYLKDVSKKIPLLYRLQTIKKQFNPQEGLVIIEIIKKDDFQFRGIRTDIINYLSPEWAPHQNPFQKPN